MDAQDPKAGEDSSDQAAVRRVARLSSGRKKSKSSLTRRNLLKGATVGSAVAVATGATVGGMTIFSSKLTSGASIAPAGQVREYWIQADTFYHNLVPTGYDGLMGMNYTANQTSYWAIGYRAYTSNWGRLLEGNADLGPNTGIPGPVLRGSVGDTIRVHFRNNDTHRGFAHSMHPHGVSYTPENDGAWFAADPRPGTMIQVGQSYTYEWQVRPNSVGTWVYHDHSSPQMSDPGGSGSGDEDDGDGGDGGDENSGSMQMELGASLGLFGFLVLTDGSVTPVDREFFTFLHDMYQSDVPVLSQDFDCFNGNAFVGNTPTLQARVGDKVRWHIGALGTEFHAFHVHGHRWSYGGSFTDTMMLGPSVATSFEFTEDNPGRWLYHCHVGDHMMGGMSGLYVVTS